MMCKTGWMAKSVGNYISGFEGTTQGVWECCEHDEEGNKY